MTSWCPKCDKEIEVELRGVQYNSEFEQLFIEVYLGDDDGRTDIITIPLSELRMGLMQNMVHDMSDLIKQLKKEREEEKNEIRGG